MDQDHKDYAEPDELRQDRRTMLEVIGIVGGVVGLVLLLGVIVYSIAR